MLESNKHDQIEKTENGKFSPVTKEELQELIRDRSVYLGDIDTSKITDMSYLFGTFVDYDLPDREDYSGIETWDVSNVTTMQGMFQCAKTFNHPIGNWDTSHVTDMTCMFQFAVNFNQSLNDWDVSNVTDVHYMFFEAYNFSQPLDKWDVSNVKNMAGMFEEAYKFNQPLDKWDVSNVKNMSRMFANAEAFNQSIDSWDTSNVTNKDSMFEGAKSFHQSPKYESTPSSEIDKFIQEGNLDFLAQYLSEKIPEFQEMFLRRGREEGLEQGRDGAFRDLVFYDIAAHSSISSKALADKFHISTSQVERYREDWKKLKPSEQRKYKSEGKTR